MWAEPPSKGKSAADVWWNMENSVAVEELLSIQDCPV